MAKYKIKALPFLDGTQYFPTGSIRGKRYQADRATYSKAMVEQDKKVKEVMEKYRLVVKRNKVTLNNLFQAGE